MGLPEPRAGLVVRYSFLWRKEAKAGADEGAKDRPAAIVVATRLGEQGEIKVIVAPITHSPPQDLAVSLEIPSEACRALGLDGERHWIRFDELNSFVWPGFDLRPIPGKGGRIDDDFLPKDVYEAMRKGILDAQKTRKLRSVPRD